MKRILLSSAIRTSALATLAMTHLAGCSEQTTLEDVSSSGRPTSGAVQERGGVAPFRTTLPTAEGAAGQSSSSEVAPLEDLEDPAQDPDAIAIEELVELGRQAGALTLEEFREKHRIELDGEPMYVVEDDMLFEREAQIELYYYQEYLPRIASPADKLIVKLTEPCDASGCIDARDLRPDPMDIRYCFAAGFGSQQYDPDGNGVFTTVPSKDSVRDQLEPAMRAWEGIAAVRFVYMSDLDGAGCTNTGPNPGVDFVIQHHNSACTGIGPWPSNSWSNQKLRVPLCGLPGVLGHHELGHALGFRHEHIHTSASPRCNENGDVVNEDFEELTDFDTLSIMKYDNCTVSNNVNNVNGLSTLDGVGARVAYGNPHWWYGLL